MPILYIDAGNTAIKLASAAGDGSWRLLERIPTVRSEEVAMAERVAAVADAEGADRICLASVVPWVKERLRQRFGGMLEAIDPTWIPQGGTRYRTPSELGIDRYLSSLGAWIRGGRRESVAVIGAGTAITLDLVSAQGIHLGGAILPGMQAIRSACELAMPALPGVDPDSIDGMDPSWPAVSTRDAILWGQAGMLSEGVRSLLQRKSPGFDRLYITGGDAEAFLRLLKSPMAADRGERYETPIPAPILDPWLLFEGMSAVLAGSDPAG